MVTAIQPEPVPMSSIFISLSFETFDKISSISSSVSGRGISTFSLIKILSHRNKPFPEFAGRVFRISVHAMPH